MIVHSGQRLYKIYTLTMTILHCLLEFLGLQLKNHNHKDTISAVILILHQDHEVQ